MLTPLELKIWGHGIIHSKFVTRKLCRFISGFNFTIFNQKFTQIKGENQTDSVFISKKNTLSIEIYGI
jgi:hypothetical protein